MKELEFLKEQNVSEDLIHGVEEFRKNYGVDEAVQGRVTRPSIPFYGKEILEMAIAGLLEGENLLLAGPKATGKNILAENLAYALAARSIMYRFMSTQTAGISSERTRL